MRSPATPAGRAALGPPAWVDTLPTWLRAVAGDPLMLNARQTRLLWREIVASSREGESLIDTQVVADWARTAWTLVREHGIELAQLEGRERTFELRALREWGRRYGDVLETRGWSDSSTLLAAIGAAGGHKGPAAAVLLDCAEIRPLERRCLERLVADGWRLRHAAPPVGPMRAQRAGAANASEELARASEWAALRAGAAPEALIALVVPSTYAPAGLVERLLGEAVPVVFAAGRRAVGVPAVAAALNALTLLSPDGAALELSHWLRSPFFQHPTSVDAGDAARLEADLRNRLVSQLPFLVAYRDGGLAEHVAARTPALAARLARAIGRIGSFEREHSPSAWTDVWRACLRELGWLGPEQAAGAHAVRTLDLAFAELAKLTAVAPRLPLGRALGELRRILDDPLVLPRMPQAGIHVLEHVDDVGPGYDGVWALGFSDGAWPERRTPNPLLPRTLQAHHGLPWSTPEDTLARSKRSIARVCTIAPEVVLSWSERDVEAARLPSPLIRSLAPLPSTAARPRLAGAPVGPAVTPAGPAAPAVAIEIVAPNSAPALAGRRIPGGAAALNSQARCPLRAFAERRLGARPLAPWSRGVTPRLRGNIVHEAVAALLAPTTTRRALAAFEPVELTRRSDAAVDGALARAFGRLRKHLAVVCDLERERLGRALQHLLAVELVRGEFEIVATEAKTAITVGVHEVGVRLDRLDRLDAGGIAIVDYKTGALDPAPEWFGARIDDVQVPLYALHVGAELAAAVLCHLSPERARYRGYSVIDAAFPGAVRPLPDALTWPQALERWSVELGKLAADFAAGDVRIRLDDTSDAEGLFAPLSRVHELRAAQRSGASE